MSMSNTFQFSIHIRVTYKQFYLQKKANKKKKNQTPYNMIYPVVAHVPSKKKKKKKSSTRVQKKSLSNSL